MYFLSGFKHLAPANIWLDENQMLLTCGNMSIPKIIFKNDSHLGLPTDKMYPSLHAV